MVASIPASAIVRILPRVITAGGSGLDLVGLLLTTSAQIPVGSVLSFASAADVSAYFGALSTEAALAQTYFSGYDGSNIKPAKLWFSRYASSAVSAYLRGGSVASLSLSDLQALSGVLTITVNGSAKTSSTINLSSATSFSNAATIITAAFTSPGFVVAYDSVSGGFTFTNSATGASSTISFATGTLSAGLKLTAATGAVTSQGSDTMVPGSAMDAVIATTQDFVSFATTWEPSDSDKLLFSAWADAQTDRYAYAGWTNSSAATGSGDNSSFAALAIANGYGATMPVYDPANGANVAAFLMGAIASINFAQENGRATLAFKTGAVIPGVSNQTIAANLKANGYNYVGRYATANDQFVFFYPGQITGDFGWIDSWISQVWMSNKFQLALMNLLTTVGSIPYNAEGYATIEASLRGVIDDALFFGAIRSGIVLSAQQKAEVNNIAGGNVSDTIEQQGWYIKVADPGADVRANRGSPSIVVFWTDGQSVQEINLSSVMVQ